MQNPYFTMFSCVIGCIILGRLYIGICYVTMSVKENGLNIYKGRTLINFKIIFRLTT